MRPIGHRPRAADRARPGDPAIEVRAEAGVTLMEVVVATLIAALVLGVLPLVVRVLFQAAGVATTTFERSAGAFSSSARFSDDVQGALPFGSTDGARRGVPGCGGGTALLRLVGDGTGGDLRVTSYHLVDDPRETDRRAIERRRCVGPTLDAALTAAPSTMAPVRGMAADTQVTVTCRATPSGPEAADDASCRTIRLSVDPLVGAGFHVDGTRRGALAEPAPQPSSDRRCTLEPVADATVDLAQPLANFGAGNIQGNQTLDVFKGAAIESTAPNPGTASINTGPLAQRDQHRTAWLHSLLRFDLAEPCVGRGEPQFLPAGKPQIRAALSLYFVRPPTVAGAYGDPATATIRAYTLDGDALWDESTVTWCSAPLGSSPYGTLAGPVGPGGTGLSWADRDDSGPKPGCGDTSSGFGWDAGLTADLTFPIAGSDLAGYSYRRLPGVDVTPSVQRWYSGEWRNNGWRLQWLPPTSVVEPTRAGGVRQPRIFDLNTGVSFRFGSREAASTRRPRLTITWCDAGQAGCTP